MAHERSLLDQIQDVAKLSFSEGRGLPPAAYLDEEVFALEQLKLFDRSWQFVGHVSEVPASGHWIARSVTKTPVLVWRDEENSIKAFANTCRHRNATIASGCGKSRKITCPYHAWTYDQSGRLIAAPHTNIERLGPQDRQLVQLATCEWLGLIFVSLEKPAALSLELQELGTALHNKVTNDLQILWHETERMQVNWKVFVENFMESYHLFAVHPVTLNRTTPTSDVKCYPGTDTFAMHQLSVRGTDRRLTGEKEVLACVFPNTLIASNHETTVVVSVEPLDVANIILKVHALGSSKYIDLSGGLEQASRMHRERFYDFHEEDRKILSNVTIGLNSRYAQEPPLTELERPIYDFVRYVANKLARV
jgi:nitrite reductase/ring-hydroxylating ferredoxin subunit